MERRCSNILSQTPWIYEVKTVQGELRAVLVAALNATTSTFSTSRQQQVNSLTTCDLNHLTVSHKWLQGGLGFAFTISGFYKQLAPSIHISSILHNCITCITSFIIHSQFRVSAWVHWPHFSEAVMTLLKATMSCTAEKEWLKMSTLLSMSTNCLARQLFCPAARHRSRCRTEAAEQETTESASCKPPKLTDADRLLQKKSFKKKTAKYTNTELDNRLSPSFCTFVLFLVSRFWKYKTPSRTNPRPFVACCQALPAVAAVASNWSSDLCASRKDLRNVRFALWAPRAQCEQAWLQSLIFDLHRLQLQNRFQVKDEINKHCRPKTSNTPLKH